MSSEYPKQASASSRYELIRQLGEGGVGTIHAALDRETGERVEMRTFFPELFHDA